MARVVLISPLRPAECAARLADVVDPEPDFLSPLGDDLGTRPVTGTVAGLSVNLRQRLEYQNPFQSYFTAALRPRGAGTAVVGSCGMHPIVTASLAGLSVATAAVLLIILSTGRTTVEGVVAAGVILAGSAGLVWYCRFLAWGEAEFLTCFVCAALEARPQEGPPT